MKKVLLIVLVILCFALVGQAEAKGYKDICDSPLGSIYNKCHVVTHPSVDKELMPIGVGLDLVLYESDIKDISYKVTAEYKYDVRNSNQSVYTVVTLKLMDIVNKIKGE